MSLGTVAKPACDDATGTITWDAAANPDGFTAVFYRVYRVGVTDPVGLTRNLTWTAADHTSGDQYQIEAASYGGLANSAAKSEPSPLSVDVIEIQTNSTNAGFSLGLTMNGGFTNPTWTRPDLTTTVTDVLVLDLSGSGGATSTILCDPLDNSIYGIGWAWKGLTSVKLPTLRDIGVVDLNLEGNAGVALDLTEIAAQASLSIINLNGTASVVTAAQLATLPTLTQMKLDDCVKSTAEVDAILIEVDSWGTSNGLLKMTGSCPGRTYSGASEAAVTALVSRGWTVNTN